MYTEVITGPFVDYRTNPYGDQGLPVAKRARTETLCTNNPQHCFMPIMIISDHNALTENCVWMELKSAQIFSTNNDSAPQHVRIANRIYRLAIMQELSAGALGITPTQHDEFQHLQAICNYNLNSVLQVLSVSYPLNIAPLRSIRFNFEPYQQYAYATSENVSLSYLQQCCHQALNDSYVAPKQSFVINCSGHFYKLTAEELKKEQSLESTPPYDSLLGQIEPTTTIDFTVENRVLSDIVQEAACSSNAVFSFTININRKDKHFDAMLLPVLLDGDDFQQNALAWLQKKKVIIGDSYIFQYAQLEFMLTAKKVNFNGNFLGNRTRLYTPYYHFDNHAVSLETMENVILHRKETDIAKEVKVVIIAIEGVQLQYLQIVDLEVALKQAIPSFVTGQCVQFNLDDRRLTAKITNVMPQHNALERDPSQWARKWQWSESSNIVFEMDLALSTRILDDSIVRPIDTIVFKVMLNSSTMAALQEKALKQAILDVGHGIFCNNSALELVLEGHHLTCHALDFTLVKKEFAPRKYGVLGKVTPETIVRVLNGSCDNFSICQRTYTQDPILELEKYCYLGFDEQSQDAVRKIFRERFSLSCEEIDKLTGGSLSQFVLLHGHSDVDIRQLASRLGNLLCCSKEQYHHFSDVWLTEALELGTKRIDDVFGPLQDVFQKASSSQELHLVVIDKIHEMFTSKSLSRQFWSRLRESEKPANVLVFATTTSYSALSGSKGNFFDAEIKLELPNSERRKALLKQRLRLMSLKNSLADDVDLNHLVKESRGFSPCELEKCVDRAQDNAIARRFASQQTSKPLPEQSLLISANDFSKALKEIIEAKPLSRHYQPQFSYYL